MKAAANIPVKKWVVPPGYRDLADVLKEYGRDRTQTSLLSGQWPAFKLDLFTGNLEPIPAPAWGVIHGQAWLEKGGASGFWALRSRGQFYALVVRVSERQPPSTDNPKDEDGPMVRLAKDLMAAEFPQGEWRQMKPTAVRKRCEQKAKTRQVQLPSPDSFSRAMGHRRRK